MPGASMDPDDGGRVRAVVMTRDDSSGGWVPLGGAGLSHITVCRSVRPDSSQQDTFLIHGERLHDQAVILECRLESNLVYNKVNPIFHHWKVDNDKFGLTFQSPADAVNFERSIHRAIEEMARGSLTSSTTCQGTADAAEGGSAIHTDSRLPSNSRREVLLTHITVVTRESSSRFGISTPLSDEIGLPQTEASTSHTQVQSRTSREEEELEAINPCKDLLVAKGYEDYRRAAEQGHREGPAEIPLQEPRGAMPLQLKKARESCGPTRCIYCRGVFGARENGRGKCQDAPDPLQRCLHQLSCMWCADSLLYHCMSDAEGNYTEPCSCDTNNPHFCARWVALALLSLVVPCMCCYLPLQACHRCGQCWGCCGGRHKAVG
ncbi:sprouty-related, EVH1 domain-containing protein 2-like isoform X2 [Narcine bancroftii]|uniref:sprouty-related, EVH1 domain-containing protein 2-like isoform X2 n=1 Tax=Narcine bancroftii TaxID=1343680 RepID=UPI003831E81C